MEPPPQQPRNNKPGKKNKNVNDPNQRKISDMWAKVVKK